MSILAWFVLSTCSGVLVFGSDEPAYDVLEKRPDFEIRRYQSYLVAETVVTDAGAYRSANNRAFRRLFNYISGQNRRAESMDTTAQVTQNQSEKIKMTVPVFSNRAADDSSASVAQTMQFVMPSKYSLATVPQPTNDEVIIKQIPERVVAVLRFSGSPRQANFKKHEERLLSALKGSDIRIQAEPEYAQYNGPFTPAFRRRNEVVVEIDWASLQVKTQEAPKPAVKSAGR